MKSLVAPSMSFDRIPKKYNEKLVCLLKKSFPTFQVFGFDSGTMVIEGKNDYLKFPTWADMGCGLLWVVVHIGRKFGCCTITTTLFNAANSSL